MRCRIYLAAAILFFFYALWQGPFRGKWAEAAFWMTLSISAEISGRNLWGKDDE